MNFLKSKYTLQNIKMSLINYSKCYFASSNYSSFGKTKKQSIYGNTFFKPDNSLYDEINQKKKRQPLFDELSTFEKSLPKIKTSNTNLKGKEMIKKLETDYYKSIIEKEKENIGKISLVKDYPKVGDIIEIEYYLSISSGKINKIRGMCVGLFNEGTFKFKFRTFFNKEGSYGIVDHYYHNPLVKSVKVVVVSNNSNKEKKLTGMRKLRYFGHVNKLLMKGGKFKINKSSSKKIKEYIRTDIDNDLMKESYNRKE